MSYDLDEDGDDFVDDDEDLEDDDDLGGFDETNSPGFQDLDDEDEIRLIDTGDEDFDD